MKKLRKLLKDKNGEGTILILIMVFVILTFSGIIAEIYRMNVLQQHIEYEMQRAVNCSVEYAMGDSWRQDKYGTLDVSLGKAEFYKYLKDDLKLDSSYRKHSGTDLVYYLELSSVSGTENPPKITVKGTLKAKSIFSILGREIEIPFNVSSINNRTD